ncbi:MAG TPA: RNA-binding domain-containing protein [Candidatus Saccharimonadales bacterium]|jgi:ATP-dependent DNA helicase RecG|nr:RNA-binding domain-containing protein [Candidatus Saccharimonadales bacterium]
MTDQELETLLADLESDRVERTTSTTDTDKFGEAICAFANDMPGNRLPGVLFIGANDNGSCGNIQITDGKAEVARYPL